MRFWIGRAVAAWVLLVMGVAWAPRASSAVLTPNERYVDLAFEDLLGRAAGPADLAGFATALDNMTLSRSAFASTILSSAEFADRETTSFFNLLLHRASTGAERTPFDSLLQGGQTFEYVEGLIAGSSEYFTNRGGGTDSGFLDAIYSDLLARPIQAAEQTSLLGALTGGTTREQIAEAILAGTEYRADMVARDYNALLRRPPGLIESNNLVGSALDERTIVQVIVTSNEYYNLAQAIPEPGGMACGLAIGLLAWRRRRY